MKCIYENLTASIILESEGETLSSVDQEQDKNIHSSLLPNTALKAFTMEIRQEN